MIGKFFYISKSKKFNIPPRFHDPDQEERDEREQRIKAELGIKDDEEGKEYKPNIKGQFRNAMSRDSKSAEDARRKSNRRLIILILIFTLIFYLFFFTDFFSFL